VEIDTRRVSDMRACVRACVRIRETKYNLTRVVRKFRADRRLQLHSRHWTAHCLTSPLKTTNSGVSIRPAYGRLFGTGCRKLFRRQSHFLPPVWPDFTKFHVGSSNAKFPLRSSSLLGLPLGKIRDPPSCALTSSRIVRARTGSFFLSFFFFLPRRNRTKYK